MYLYVKSFRSSETNPIEQVDTSKLTKKLYLFAIILMVLCFLSAFSFYYYVKTVNGIEDARNYFANFKGE